ncbi:MAG: hypothetical protein R3258_03365 [Acidimicrobiia bacterium]|nr:hypothetical protein [Acidimicrobiia bacterium]
METHETDPTAYTDPWDRVSGDVAELRARLKETYREAAGDQGPSEDDIRDAFSTLAGAWSQMASSVASALKDPEVREQLKSAAGSIASALGRTISELGSELDHTSEEE